MYGYMGYRYLSFCDAQSGGISSLSREGLSFSCMKYGQLRDSVHDDTMCRSGCSPGPLKGGKHKDNEDQQ